MLAGYRGKVGAISAMIGGLAGFMHDWSTGDLTWDKATVYWAVISGGLSLFGIRAKLD